MDHLRRAGRRLGCALLAGVLTAAAATGAATVQPAGWVLRAAALLFAPAAVEAVGVLPSEPDPPALAAAAAVPPTPSPSPAPPTPTPAPQPTPAPSPGAEPTPAPLTTAPPDLEDAGPIEARHYGQGSGEGYVTLAAGSIKNSTEHSDDALARAARGELPFTVQLDSPDPQVLILHTHATETYQTWEEPVYDPDFAARTADTSLNMCAVGARMAQVLNEAGVNTLHDTTLHDSPSYTESYGRSADTARAYLERYPSIKVILDVHRDALEANGTRIKPVCELEGKTAAQVMIIAGCDNGGTVSLPHWQDNLKFAAAWETAMETAYPGLTRPVLCGYRFYNQDVTTGSLLLEVGGHANTLEEAVRAGEYAARALAGLFGAEI